MFYLSSVNQIKRRVRIEYKVRTKIRRQIYRIKVYANTVNIQLLNITLYSKYQFCCMY